MTLIRGIVGVATCIKAIEGAAVIGIKPEPELDPLGQIRIRDKVAAERDQAGVAIRNSGFRSVRFEAAGGDKWTPKKPCSTPVPQLDLIPRRPTQRPLFGARSHGDRPSRTR
jgi:hypothetical protein